MIKPQLKLPSINLNKTFWLVTLAVTLVLAVFLYGAVRAEQAKDAQHRADVSQKAAEQAQKQAEAKAYATVQGALNIQSAKVAGACSYIAQLATAPKTRALVVVPAACK